MPVSAFEKLSDMIQSRVADARARKQKSEDMERDNQMKIIMAGVQAHAQNGTLTDDMIQNAQAQMQKLVPKDSIPLIEGWNKVMGMIGKKRKQGQGAAQTGPAQAATPNVGQSAQSPVPAAPTAPGTQSSQGSPAPKPSMFPSAADMGTAAGQQQVAQEQVIRQDRMASAEAANKWYESQGKTMPEGEKQAMQLWALTGHFPPAAFGRTKTKYLPLLGPDGEIIPGLQFQEGEDMGKVIGPDGKEVENPRLAPKWKPGRGWAKDTSGKFFSFAIDPATNQPIKGTEDYSALPPSQYLEHYKEGMYYFTDDSGNVHAIPNPTRTGVVTSGSGAPMGDKPAATPAVPPSMRGPGQKPKQISSSTSKGKSGGRVVGTKDTGVLSTQAQAIISKTQPVLDQVDRLMADIDKLGLQDNNDSGYLFTSMMKYKFGKASPDGTLGNDIAGLSLGSVVEAASALGGTSRSLQALKKALVHTPNPWVDSPKLMREKLQTIKDRLNDIVQDANEFGRKRQPSTAGPASTEAVPSKLRGPSKQLTPDEEAEQYLAGTNK